MIFLKLCPKCRGDPLLDSDVHGRYLKCLQCGYLRDMLVKPTEIVKSPEPIEEIEAA